ncbi:hypothetical protein CEXT_181511 [Caerostris extrusa]|uniref:Uncharacterized protein n=1 Tax=Caerostris extrusa TaxID=172846 RepID=A0AAV4RGS5_CAEEX|nr:hypothetical protein CEXT_181511 [Caerostris extrusa]
MSRFESGCSCLFGQRLMECAGHHRKPSGLRCMQLCVVGMVVLVERVGREDGQCGQGYAGQSDGRLPRRACRAAVAGVAGRASRQQRLDAERLARLGGGLGAGHPGGMNPSGLSVRGERRSWLCRCCVLPANLVGRRGGGREGTTRRRRPPDAPPTAPANVSGNSEESASDPLRVDREEGSGNCPSPLLLSLPASPLLSFLWRRKILRLSEGRVAIRRF